jgi:hypothetical protein
MLAFHASWAYDAVMAVPLSIAIIALTTLLGLVTWLYVRSQAENARLVERILEISTNYSDYTLKSAEKMTRDVPKMAEKMLDSLARGIADVTRGTSEAMQAIYGPVRVETEQAQAAMGDIITPWYGEEGSLDTLDPTDALLVADPVEHPEGGSNLIMDGDDEPFGVPGLKLDAGI